MSNLGRRVARLEKMLPPPKPDDPGAVTTLRVIWSFFAEVLDGHPDALAAARQEAAAEVARLEPWADATARLGATVDGFWAAVQRFPALGLTVESRWTALTAALQAEAEAELAALESGEAGGNGGDDRSPADEPTTPLPPPAGRPRPETVSDDVQPLF